jgi:D-arabinose 1-dehydrogenase-like Zn-dependent alcohol dehydrogenase
MKAVQMVAAGSPLEMKEIPTPAPGAGEVLVRVRAAGICHSDVHYRAGLSAMGPLPLTLGHEIAGTITALGHGVAGRTVGERVAIHYLKSCGQCLRCKRGEESWCDSGAMLGHHTDGGFAEFVLVPARNAVPLPESVPFEVGAILMCSSATALHALRRSRLAPGETVAVFGVGGIGVSAIQLARQLGASRVIAVDLDPAKLAIAKTMGAEPVNGGDDVVSRVQALTARGVDVALEMVGLRVTMRQAVDALAPRGRAVIVGIGERALTLDPYHDLVGREIEVMGSNDHTLAEVHELVALAAEGRLDLAPVIASRVPLQAAAINAILDDLAVFRGGVRAVVVP